MRQTQYILVPGPAGQIEARFDTPAQDVATGRVMVLCHPHPQYGGSMHDAVLDSLAEAAARNGLAQLRFNFRGVGASAGTFDNGVGEVEDLCAILAWLRQNQNPSSMILAGYSFGSNIVWRGIDDAGPVDRILLIAPPVTAMEFPPRPQLSVPVSIVSGDADDFTNSEALAGWAAHAAPSARLITIAGADHFFGGHYTELAATVESEVST